MRSSSAWGSAAQVARPWTQRVGAFVALPDLIRRLGADPVRVLRGAGLDETSLAHPENRVPYTAFVRVLDHAAEETRCPHFGLLAGRMYSLAGLGALGELVRHAGTIGRGLEALAVYQHINSEGGLVFLLKRGDFVDVGYTVYHPGTPSAAQMYDAAIAAGMNYLSELAGPAWKPYEVLLARVKPEDVAQYRALFKVVPRFDAEYSALRFPVKDLTLRIADADPEAYRRAERRVRAAGPPDFLQQVYRGLRRLMLENRHSGDDLAQMLAMHRRTLNRRLKAGGTTFQRVLDDVRFEVARDLLSNTNVHLDDVAATLGYAAVTPFMRTFRRWSGTTPGQWRRSMRSRAAGIGGSAALSPGPARDAHSTFAQ